MGNDYGGEDQSGEESFHKDDDEQDHFENDSYCRQVKEIQKKAIAVFSELKRKTTRQFLIATCMEINK